MKVITVNLHLQIIESLNSLCGISQQIIDIQFNPANETGFHHCELEITIKFVDVEEKINNFGRYVLLSYF